MKLYLYIKITALILFIPVYMLAKESKNAVVSSKHSIWEIVSYTEDNIDIGFWALVIAKEYDPKINIDNYLEKLNAYSTEIKRMLAGRTRDIDKFLAVKTFLYEKGIWNNNKIFSYDLDDPFGEHVENQLLSTYMDSKNGNCVSMPTLFLALMQRVAPEVKFSGVKAPMHLFCRLKDSQTGDVWNVETTNGGSPARNQWYIDQMHIPQLAVRKGLFLRDLKKKEYIAELISSLIVKERKSGNIEKAFRYTELVLKLSPNSDLGLISKGALLAEMGYRLSKAKGDNLSGENKKKLEFYKSVSAKYIAKAKALGWKPESREERENYLKSVKQQKNK